ncbi:MAG TPA: class I SAM-dependent methyltransferase [Oscillatoriales cyanobacterium M59_W2019_021]|nr:class I SAM-dependent methyltransferase [Oscillatoriales cyanobacterium M4454_W2019_049]HIK49979.1 class I SAM-dependent methyltransferase [Oscillatoriales cyanobacterium M59_W2019_021]
MKYVKCNLCGSDNYTILFEKEVAQVNQIVRCNVCNLMYANPREKDADVVSIEKYTPEFVLSQIDNRKTQRADKEALKVRDYETTKLFLNQNFNSQKAKLVEIGSGLGYLANFFQQDGWDVVGVEPNTGMCKYAEREFGLKVISTTIEKSGIAANSVDVVLTIHTIEHVPDPCGTFQEVYRILKPGGIFVLETPRYDTLMFKIMQERERSLRCDGHIYFFTHKTLTQMAQKTHFEVLKIDDVGRSMTVDRLFYNLGVVSKSSKIQKSLNSIAQKFHLNQMWIYLNLQDMQRVYLTKPNS